MYDHACSPGTTTTRIEGSVWMKAQSREASGQFPAQVVATAETSKTLAKTLKMEVTNLVGGTEALITAEGDSITIRDARGKVQKQRGSWAGIPLRWATELFLGRIPCPEKSAARLSVVREHLIAEVGSEKFEYSFRNWGGELWPEHLSWTKAGGPSLDFKFDDPEDHSASPRRWEARSAKGEVKVRWRDRKRSPGN